MSWDTIVTVKVQDGWHIYANPAGLPEMKPTTLGLEPTSDQSARLLTVSYPRGESKILGSLGAEKVALYEGKVEFNARPEARRGRRGPARSKLSSKY